MELEKIIKSTVTSIDESCKVIRSFLIKNSKEYSTSHKYSLKFLLEYIERSCDILKSVSNIFTSTEQNSSCEHSVGVLLRSSLFDTATLIFIEIEASNKNNPEYFDELEKLVKRVFGDHFNYYSTLVNDLKDRYRDFIEENDNGKIKSIYGKGFKSGKLKQKFIEKDVNFYLTSIDNWEWYSKYEHFGILSYDLQRNSVIENNYRHCTSILVILFGIVVTLNMLEDIDAEVIIEKEEKKITDIFHNYLCFLTENGIIDSI